MADNSFILPIADIQRREQELKQRMVKVGQSAADKTFSEVASTVPDVRGLSSQTLADIGAEAEQANVTAQQEQFPGEGVTRAEVNPRTGEEELVRTGATPVVFAERESGARTPESPEQAVARLRDANAMVNNETNDAQVAINRQALATVASAGPRWIKPPAEFAPDKLKARMMRLQAFERQQNLRPGEVAVKTTELDVVGASGRRRRKGKVAKVVLAPHEVEDVALRANELMENPATGKPITEEEYQAIKLDLSTTMGGNEFIRMRNNAEVVADADIEQSVATFNNSNDVSEFIEKYEDNNLIKDYVASRVAEEVSSSKIQRKLAVGNKLLAKEQKAQAFRTQEINSNAIKYEAWLSREKRLAPDLVKEEVRKLKAGDEVSQVYYNQFKSESDYIAVDEEGNVKTVTLDSDRRKRLEQDRMVSKTIADKTADINDPEVEKHYIKKGATPQSVSIKKNQVKIVADFPPPEGTTIQQIPANVDPAQLAREAYNSMITDGVDYKTAINSVVDDVDADDNGKKSLKNQVAKQLVSISDEVLNVVSETERLDQVEANINTLEKVGQWTERFSRMNHQDSPLLAVAIDEAGGIIPYLLGQSEPGKTNYRPGALGTLSEEEWTFINEGLAFAQSGNERAVNYGSVSQMYDIVNQVGTLSDVRAEEDRIKNNIKDGNLVRKELSERGYDVLAYKDGRTVVHDRAFNTERLIYSVVEEDDVKNFTTQDMANAYRDMPSKDDKNLWLEMVGGADRGIYGSTRTNTEVSMITDMLMNNTESKSLYMSADAVRRLDEDAIAVTDAVRALNLAGKADVKVDEKILKELNVPEAYQKSMLDPVASKAMNQYIKTGDLKYYTLAMARAHHVGASAQTVLYGNNRQDSVKLSADMAQRIGAVDGFAIGSESFDGLQGFRPDGTSINLSDPAQVLQAVKDRIKTASPAEQQDWLNDREMLASMRSLTKTAIRNTERNMNSLSNDYLELPGNQHFGLTQAQVEELDTLKDIAHEFSKILGIDILADPAVRVVGRGGAGSVFDL